eukprot:gene20524-27316_t
MPRVRTVPVNQALDDGSGMGMGMGPGTSTATTTPRTAEGPNAQGMGPGTGTSTATIAPRTAEGPNAQGMGIGPGTGTSTATKVPLTSEGPNAQGHSMGPEVSSSAQSVAVLNGGGSHLKRGSSLGPDAYISGGLAQGIPKGLDKMGQEVSSLGAADIGRGGRTPWKDLPASAYNSPNQHSWEAALATTYSVFRDYTPPGTEDELAELLKWLRNCTGKGMYKDVHELRDRNVRGVYDIAMKVVAKEECEEKLGELLRSMSEQLEYFNTSFGYPFLRRISLISTQLFRLHRESASIKGAVQFVHVSKSGGTNLCQAAQASGCSTEGFDERHNCLIRAFEDVPHWVSHEGHEYVKYRTVNSADKRTPWFVNFKSGRHHTISCQQRMEQLRQESWIV